MDKEMITEFILPKEICSFSNNVTSVQTLFKEKDIQIGLNEKEYMTVSGRGYIVLDFGMEYSGGVRILTFLVSKPETKIRLRFGESISEAYS